MAGALCCCKWARNGTPQMVNDQSARLQNHRSDWAIRRCHPRELRIIAIALRNIRINVRILRRRIVSGPRCRITAVVAVRTWGLRQDRELLGASCWSLSGGDGGTSVGSGRSGPDGVLESSFLPGRQLRVDLTVPNVDYLRAGCMVVPWFDLEAASCRNLLPPPSIVYCKRLGHSRVALVGELFYAAVQCRTGI